MTTLINSNEEIEDIIKIVKSLKKSALLIKGVSKTIQKALKGQKGGFFGILLGKLSTILLVNIFGGKGVIQVGEKATRAGQDV